MLHMYVHNLISCIHLGYVMCIMCIGIVCRYTRANINTSHTSCCVAAPPSSFIAALNLCFAWIRWNLVSYQQFSEAPR